MDGGSVHLKGSIIPEDLVQINQTVAGIAHENEKIGLEYRVRMENGEIRYRYCNARSFLAGDSHDLHLVGLNTDITPLRTAQNALHEAMKKLSIMTSITRHDIMNAVAVIEMGTEILLDEATDEEMRLVIADIGQAGRKINTLIRFTSQYQELGQHEPVWVDIVTILSQPWVRDLIGNRSLTLPKPGTLIYGDRMIEKVLYNLLENSIRHGGVVHSLSFSYRFQDNDLLILYTDDGQGIASHEKDLIFNRDYGKNTGMGLFLIQEILAITGLTVIEDGQPGSGARFVIRVGPGLFKA
jgi:signal transduction histidine kinase